MLVSQLSPYWQSVKCMKADKRRGWTAQARINEQPGTGFRTPVQGRPAGLSQAKETQSSTSTTNTARIVDALISLRVCLSRVRHVIVHVPEHLH